MIRHPEDNNKHKKKSNKNHSDENASIDIKSDAINLDTSNLEHNDKDSVIQKNTENNGFLKKTYIVIDEAGLLLEKKFKKFIKAIMVLSEKIFFSININTKKAFRYIKSKLSKNDTMQLDDNDIYDNVHLTSKGNHNKINKHSFDNNDDTKLDELKDNDKDNKVFPDFRYRHSGREKALTKQRKVNVEKKDNGFGFKAETTALFKPRNHNRSFLVSTVLSLIMVMVIFIAFVGVSGLGAILGIVNAYVDTTPILDLAKIENLEETSFIYDDKGVLITTYSGLENRIYAPIDEIPMMLQSAFVATEDARFYTHNGIDPKRIFGAFFNNLRTDTTQGGSTITQQLIKLRLLSFEQTYKRKLQEAYLAVQLEQQYTKDQILEAYLNTIDLGAGNYGVKAAALDYFGKELSELTLRECAIIAGVANSPYLYNPRSNFFAWNTPDRSNSRTNIVLYRMYQIGNITKEQYDQGIKEIVLINAESKKQQLYDMPYFLEYAIVDVVEHMLRARNMVNSKTNRSIIENELRTEGYHIHTTVDKEVQLIVEDTLYNWQSYPRMQQESDSVLITKNKDGTTREVIQPQAAAVVFDYNTGQIKAIVGGRQEPTVLKGLNRAYQSHMPVGSSIKPIAIYGPALNKGYSPANVFLDLPIEVDGWLSERGYPNNYGGTFSGPVPMRKALVNSINMVAVRMLVDNIGIEESFNTLVDLGINPDNINKDGAGLALGTSGITTLEMAVAFGAIGNNGAYIEPIAFSKVLDSRGNIIIDATESRIVRHVFTPAATWLLVDMLTQAVNSGTGTKARISNMTVAGKTGTNSGYNGVFFTGLTPYYSSAVWIGHDSYEPLYRNSTGGSNAAPIWKEYMERIHTALELPNDKILDTVPSELGLTKATVCSVSGLLPTEACYQDADGRMPVTDYFQEGTVPTDRCDQHTVFMKCNDTSFIASPYCPNTSVNSYVLIASDSSINKLDSLKFSEYFPNGLRNLPPLDNIQSFNYDNPVYTIHFCPVHTLDWYNNSQQMLDIVSYANTLITQVEALMNTYGNLLTDHQSKQITDEITTLKELKNAQNDYDSILTSTNTLQIYKETYLDPLLAQGEG